jgi:cobalt-precorrin-5B (C1)-methyltransferase
MGKTTAGKLRSGFTTGAAAAAAAKGALLSLLAKKPPHKVQITFLTGTKTKILLKKVVVESPKCALSTVIKDAGDDPDVTHKAEIGARVTLVTTNQDQKVSISGGKGVGMVTKPGLEIPPGHAAINPGPLRMITNEVVEALNRYNRQDRVYVEVFVPKGEELALKTLNARLGILGGLSILGTTGIERPMSHEAYLATIEKALSVARACGLNEVILTTGRRSERFAQVLWPQISEEAFVQMGDFFKATLEMAALRSFFSIIVVVFLGKALKMAVGTPHTHASRSELTLNRLADWTKAKSGHKRIAARIRKANTARQAFELLKKDYSTVIDLVAQKVLTWARQFSDPKIKLRVIILDYNGQVAADSLKKI